MRCLRRAETRSRAGSPSCSPAALESWDKFVSCTVDCQKMFGPRWIRLQLLAQFKDLVIDCSGRWVRIISPNLIEQSFAGKHALRILSEEFQQLELVRSKDNRPAVAADRHFFKIDFAIGESAEGRDCTLSLPADCSLNPGRKLPRPKGFNQ